MTTNFDYYHDPSKPRRDEVEVFQYLYEKHIGKCYDLAQVTRFYEGDPQHADYSRYFTNLPTVYLGQYLGNSFHNVWSKNNPTPIEHSFKPKPIEYYFRNNDGTIITLYKGFFLEVPCRALDISNEINTRETSIPTLQSLALNAIPTSEIKYARLLNNNSNVNLTEINKEIASGLGNENLKDSVEATMSRVKEPLKNKKCNKSKGCTIMGGKKYTKKSKKNKRKSRKNKRKSRKLRKSKN
jgi:hypothetical protein